MKAVILVLAVLLTSCTSISDVMKAWEGKHKKELIMEWGPPTKIDSDGGDGEVYSYIQPSRWQPQATSYQQFGQTYYNTPQTQMTYRYFYVDKDGYIYAWRWQGE
jgi:hypothetical protein